MPFLAPEVADAAVDLLPGQVGFPTPPKVEEKSQSVVDVLAAGARVGGNLVTAAYDRAWEPSLPDADPDYRPWADIAGYEDYAKEFIRSGSMQETQVIKQRIDEALAARRVVDQAGGWGMAAAIAGSAFDPATLASIAIPIAPVLGGAARGERIYAGISGALAIDTAAEAALHEQNPTRTLGESAFRVSAGALMSGALGTLVTRIPRAELEAMRRQLQGDMKAPVERGGDSVGAMRAGNNLTLDDLTISTKVGRFIAKTVGRISPLDRVMRSSTKAARALAAEIAEIPYKLNMNFKGHGITALETRAVQREMAQRYGVNQMLDEAYTTYAKRVGGEAISFPEFRVRASQAARRKDVSDIPEVGDLVRNVRSKILDPDKAELQRLGVLEGEIDLMGGKSYFPRMWDAAVVSARGTKLRDKLARHFAKNPPDEMRPDGTMGPSKALDDAELKALVEEVISHIRGTTRSIADIATITVPGQLKKRVLNIPEDEFEEFLVNDFEAVMSGYIRAMAPQIEARKAGFAKMNFEDELRAVHDEYDALRTNAKSDKAIQALDAEEEAVLTDLKSILLRATNQAGPKTGDKFAGFVTAGRLVRAYNYATKLGGQTLSSFSDFGHIATRYGATRTLATLGKFLLNSGFNKLTRADSKRMGVAVDWILDSRTSTLAEIGDELGSSKIERAAEWATKKFTRATGMATWNSTMKALTAALEQDQLVRYLQKGKDLSAFNKAKLAEYGIGDDEIRRIMRQQEHFDDSEGMWRLRTDEWSDRGAAEMVEQAISKAANIMVIRKGAGDLPLLMDSEMAKTIFQFKSFGMAAVNRIMIPVAQGLSHGDAATANGFAMMLALGAMTYTAKEYAAGRVPDLSPGQLAKESMNWSGVLGYMPDVWDPLTLTTPKSVRQQLRFSKFKDVSAAQTLAGPTFGAATDTIGMISGLADGEGVSQRDLHNVRKAFVPMQNVFYLRRIIDALEGEAGEAIGAEGATSDQFVDRITKTEEPKQ